MAMSQAWYDSTSASRCIIAKVGVYSTGVAESVGEKVKYFSNRGYNTSTADILIDPSLTGTVKFAESISADGGVSISYGDLEIDNTDGSKDLYLDIDSYVWVNRSIQLYYGDPTQIVSDAAGIASTFDLIFDGVIVDIGSRNRNSVNIRVRDKMERLNAPISENTLGTYGTWGAGVGQTNQASVLPLIFGEPHNVQPLLIDPSILEYQINDGAIEQLTEIRDNGVPIYTVSILTSGATVNLTTGKFQLNQPLVGDCTVSVQGAKASIDLNTGTLSSTYNNNIASLVALIVTQYGPTSSKLSASELDLANLLAFSTSNIQYVGLAILDRQNILAVCQELASSVGAQLYFTRQGKLQLLQYGIPTSDTLVNITNSDIIANSLSISNRSSIIAAKKLGYCKNWYIQNNLGTATPVQHKFWFGEDYWLKTSEDTAGNKTVYKLNLEPIQKNTLLIDGTQTATEADRLNNYFGNIKTTYRFTGTSRLLTLKLGQSVNITNGRFGLQSGKTGQVVALEPNWSTGLIDIEVVI